MYFPCSSRTVAVMFTSSTSTLSLNRGSWGSVGGVCGCAFSWGGFCCGCAAMDTTPAHKTPRRPIAKTQTCFRAFIVSSLFSGLLPHLYFVPVSGLRPHFIRLAEELKRFSQWPSRTTFRFQFGISTTRFLVPLGTLWQLSRLLGVRPGANDSSSSSASLISEIVSRPWRTIQWQVEQAHTPPPA